MSFTAKIKQLSTENPILRYLLSFIDNWVFPVAVFFMFCFSHVAIFMGVVKFLFAYKILRFFKTYKSTLFGLLLAILLVPGIYGFLVGVGNSNIGVYYESKLYLLAFLLFSVIFWKSSGQNISNLLRVSEVCGWIIVTMTICFIWMPQVLSDLGVPVSYFLPFAQPFNGYIKFNSIQITPLIFIVPAVLIRLWGVFRWHRLILCTLMVANIFMSGRRSLILATLLVLICLTIFGLFRKQFRRALTFFLIPLMSIVLMSLSISFDLGSYTKMVSGALDFNPNERSEAELEALSKQEEELYESYAHLLKGENLCVVNPRLNEHSYGADVRKKQFLIGWSHIKRSILFGHGLGYFIPNCVRSEMMPWRFELSYMEVALAVGLIGLGIYILYYISQIYLTYRKWQWQNVHVALLVGSICFVICSASNPYIMSTVTIWVFMIPYMLANQEKS